MKLSIRKINTKDGKRFNNHAVFVNGQKVGVIGKGSTYSTDVLFMSCAAASYKLDCKRFPDIEAAKKYVKSLVLDEYGYMHEA